MCKRRGAREKKKSRDRAEILGCCSKDQDGLRLCGLMARLGGARD